MSRWFRFYDDAINDPKILKLSDGLHRVWIGILCIASKNDGALPPIEDIALMIRMKPEKARAAVEKLIAAGLIDQVEGEFHPHNWGTRQYKSDVSTDRVKRFRNAERNVSETPPETEQKQIAETEPGSDEPVVRSKLKYPPAFEGWWLAYPKTPIMSKKVALAAWTQLSPEDRLRAVTAIAPYRKFLSEKPDHPAVHACRFLSQRRFDGFEASTGPPDDAPKGWRPGLPTHEELKRKYAQNEPQSQGGEVLESGAGAQPDAQISRGDQARNGRMVQLGSLFPPPGIQAVRDDDGRAEPDENRGIHGPSSMA